MRSPFGFWSRQFQLPPTTAQAVWDVLFGMVLPLGCLVGDQILFGGENHVFRHSVFGTWWVLAYSFILTEVGLLGLWLVLRRRVHRSAAFFAGPLLAGWIFSFGTALAMLPLSVIGLLFVIGILGFSPWLTTFAFYRNWKMARQLSGQGRRLLLTLAGIVFAVTPAIVMETRGDYLIRRIIQEPSSSSRIDRARWQPFLPVDKLEAAWQAERNEARKLALADAHVRLAGRKLIEDVD